MTNIEPLMCANGPHTPVGPLHNIGTQEQQRLICHGCWTLGGLLDDQQAERGQR